MSVSLSSSFEPRGSSSEIIRSCLLFLSGCLFTGYAAYAVLGVDRFALDMGQVARLIQTTSPEPVTPEVHRDTLLKAVAASQDKYSRHFNPEEYQAFQRDLDGELVGIGVYVVDTDDGVQVGEVFAGGGAAEAGLQRGDVLVRAGTLDLAQRQIDLAAKVATMRGEAGTRVALTVRRDGKVFERQGTRKAITVPSVRSDVFSYHGHRVGFFVIDEFKTHSETELSQQLAARIDRLDALVLDVSGNPGGVLEVVSYIAALFLKQESTLYWLVNREHPDGEPIKVEFDKAALWQDVFTPAQLKKLETLPLIVLANGASASASELLAGALQDHGRAKVFGTKTFGKGSVQSLFDLDNGEAVKLTTARYLTPYRHPVDGVGIQPDYAPVRRAKRSQFPDFEYGTFPKDELNPNWLLRATAKLIDTPTAKSIASR